MIFLIAAAQLSATDIRDLRCVYVFQTVAAQLTGEERSAVQGTQQWFEGRLSARQPTLNVFDYVNEHFAPSKGGVSDIDIIRCGEVFTDWEAKEIAGKPPK